jgi:F-type H+-transporting ATP synthase subunit e
MRWSALVIGVFYGFYHQSNLTAQAKAAKIELEYQQKESLIQQAKAEWVKKTLPPEKKTASGGSMCNPLVPCLPDVRSGNLELGFE